MLTCILNHLISFKDQLETFGSLFMQINIEANVVMDTDHIDMYPDHMYFAQGYLGPVCGF